MATSEITSLTRKDLYYENSIEKIVEAQKSSSSQTLIPFNFDGNDSNPTRFRVYAIYSNKRLENSDVVAFLPENTDKASAQIMAKAELPAAFNGYAPTLNVSIRLSFTKKR